MDVGNSQRCEQAAPRVRSYVDAELMLLLCFRCSSTGPQTSWSQAQEGGTEVEGYQRGRIILLTSALRQV